MLYQRTLKHFRLFRSPFINEIRNEDDIFLSKEHIFLRELMTDAAKHQGFIAAYGGVGSGKSTMRKAVVRRLEKDGIKIIYPVIIDKARIYPGSLIDSVIFDISDERPRRTLEDKTRQALGHLKARASTGMKQVLIIEEAHLLTPSSLKALKQLYELEDGFDRLIGIILIGQKELADKLDESKYPQIREVARRVTLAEITGLNKDIADYLNHKFARTGKKADEVFASDAYEGFARRLNGKAYPLTVNNLAEKAMNLTAEIGESLVSAEIIQGV